MGCGASTIPSILSQLDDSTHVMMRKAGPHEEFRPRADHPLLRPIATNKGTGASDANGDGAAAAVDTANGNAATGTPRRAGPHEESRPRADHPLSRPIATNNGTEASDANGDANGDGAAAAVDTANGNTTGIIELSVYITIMGCGASTRPSILSQLDDSIPVMMRRAGPYKAHCNKWNRCWDILADAPGYECMNSDVGRTSCHSTNTII